MFQRIYGHETWTTRFSIFETISLNCRKYRNINNLSYLNLIWFVSTSYRTHCWQNSFGTSSKNWELLVANLLLLKITNYSLWNCLATYHYKRLLLGWNTHTLHAATNIISIFLLSLHDFDKVLYSLKRHCSYQIWTTGTFLKRKW